MPCDVCSKGEGCYALSTTETITNPGYWEYFFRFHFPQQIGIIGKNGKGLGSYVLARAADKSGWALCESCIQMYPIDRSKARQRFQAWEKAGNPPRILASRRISLQLRLPRKDGDECLVRIQR